MSEMKDDVVTRCHKLVGCYNCEAVRTQCDNCKTLLEAASEIERLRVVLRDAAEMLNTIMERRDGHLTGPAWGDVENVRLDLLQGLKHD